MNEHKFGDKTKQDLNYGMGRLDNRVLERLKLARECALDAFAAHPVTENTYAFAGHRGQAQERHHHGFSLRKWLPFVTLALVLAGAVYWQQLGINHDDDVDAALLASDLPLNAYIDHDFHPWHDSSSPR